MMRDGATFVPSSRSLVPGSGGSVALFRERSELLGLQVYRFAKRNPNLRSPVPHGERRLLSGSCNLPVLAECLEGTAGPVSCGSTRL